MVQSGLTVTTVMPKFFSTLFNFITMKFYLSIFELILGTIGMIYSFYEIHRDTVASRKGRQGQGLGTSGDTTPIKFRKHA
jgi:hypothetical protein